LEHHDFVALQETHATAGFVHIAALPRGARFWWAHATQQMGGIGFGVSHRFLARFHLPREEDWVVLDPGRLAQLRLRGPEGAVHLYVVYMATGDGSKEQRGITR